MKTIILSFNFSKLSDETSPKFTSFTEKMQLYVNIFQQKYDLAKQRFPNARIILVSHENAITRIDDTNSQVIDYEEHLLI
ncbi:hypothetical protein [Legionella worsleiensis]|uniref:Uncharacterized protein n=1 Tax=Legionella worsleiensis TaxID=45076 RepID=A0A0W1AJG0_9GAMM|nr:hypothetical protein [Legionella worsleiensis]KTD81519.1 hypothetical protein Lwor_0557 [Legionella worsleiensis]STY32078.1 Uncharacterised protein [Legionella worsleiensis]